MDHAGRYKRIWKQNDEIGYKINRDGGVKMKAFDIIQIGRIPYSVLRVYKLRDTEYLDLFHRTRYTAYSFINNRTIDTALVEF